MLLLGANSTGTHGGGIAEAVDFDGTNDYLSRSSDLTGNADGKTFTFSAWVWWGGVSNGDIYVSGDSQSSPGNGYFRVSVGNNTLRISGFNSVGTQVFTVPILGNINNVPYTWVHFVVSASITAQNAYVYVNDALYGDTGSYAAGSSGTIKFTKPLHLIGDGVAASPTKTRLAHVYLDYTYRDLSIEANRRLFITADRKPADMATLKALNPILYLPMTDPSTVHINKGTGGNFTLNGVVARSGRGPNQFNAPYSDLDGSADYLSRTTLLSGITDGKQFTFAVTVAPKSLAATIQLFVIGKTGASPLVVVQITSNGRLYISARNSAGTQVLFAEYSLGPIVGRNYQISVSFDLSDSAKRIVTVNGVDVSSSVTWTTYTNDIIDFTSNFYLVGAFRDPSIMIIGSNAKYGNVFFDTRYIDLSVQANREKFVTGTGIDAKPVDLGANGELPLGTSPLIYLPMYANNAGKNYGTGGDFTVNSGPFTGARGPNEFWGNKADFDGSTGYLSRTSALSGLSSSKRFSFSFWLNPDATTSGYILNAVDSGNNNKISIYLNNEKFAVVARNSSNTAVLSVTTSTTSIPNGQPSFVHVSIDMDSTSSREIYINGVANSATWSTYTVGATIDLSAVVAARIGVQTSTAYLLDGKLSEFYFTTDYIDFSQEANRLKFRDAFGNPVDLMPQIEAGEIPNPAIYMRFDPANFGKNSGTGGDFVKSGTILDAGQL